MRRILIIVFALLTGVSTFVVLGFRQEQSVPIEMSGAERETLYVLTFSQDFPRGTFLDKNSFIWQEQLLGSYPEDSVTSVSGTAEIPDSVLGMLLRRDVIAGEPLRLWMLVDGSAGFMALTLSPGMRAIAIPITTQKLAGGFILPDDRVDVIHTSNRSDDNLPGVMSQTILENLRVLAIGAQPASRITFQTSEQQTAATTRESDMNLTGDTITLEVTDVEAEYLLSAILTGQVSLALRALDDHGPSRIVSTIGLETASSSANAATLTQTETSFHSETSVLTQLPPHSVTEKIVAQQERQSFGHVIRIIGGTTGIRLIDVAAPRNGVNQ